MRLSDLHPNQPAFAHARAESNAHIEYEEQPVSAADVPAQLAGFRTLFAAFHHFPPDTARAVLEDAVRRGRGIGVFEPIERSVPNMLGMLLTPIVCLALTPFIRPFRWSRLVLTYLVPIVPLVILFDGVVSCLRTYTPDELRALVAELGPAPYAWEIGTARMPASPVALTFLIGTPRASN